MSAVETSVAAAHDAAPGETTSAPPAEAAAPPPDDGTRLSNERPFPGLRPFGFADRGFFFGRERQAFALYRLVENGRFIAVIGSSGSGKSSLVLAGLQGLLAEETADSGGPNWVFLDMRPGGAPIARLARTLTRLSDKDSADESARRRDRIEWTLRQSSFSFESALEAAGGLSGRALLLVVDQFEELFRFGLAGLALRRASVEEARARDEATQFVQILLDADRRRLKDVHVLVTMRSDFIGDCAYFHGLSEAASATQYLVPNLTRSQLEEVIRKPVDDVGASIEPELVERLINDCGDELDQLPVLQHCLMRLWDRAGAASAQRPRQLTRQTYDDIGGMTEALSRHADDVLAQCVGKDVCVEQAFRALSELDRDGRATRRALRFDKLLAETGVGEGDLRAVLDRFRAPGCSFVMPPLAATPKLAQDDRVDIGHEALLRRWKKLAGETDRLDARTGRPKPGWLGEEQIDGQRYRTLLSLLGDTPDDEKAVLRDPEGTKRWWDSLPRTAAWAERYGGRFDAVTGLIEDNIAAKKRAKRTRLLAAIAAAVVALGFIGTVVKLEIDNARAQRAAIAAQQVAIRQSTVLAKRMVDEVKKGYYSGALGLEAARDLGGIAVQILSDLRQTQKTDDVNELYIDALNITSDLEGVLLEIPQQLKFAREAADVAKPLVAANSSNPDFQQKSYDSSVRVGDAYALSTDVPDRLKLALESYLEAMKTAQDLVALRDNDATEGNVIDAHMKVGDIHEMISSEHEQAMAEYRAGLAVCETALAKFPDSLVALRDRGKSHYRIAEALRQHNNLDDAESEYRLAEKDQLAIIVRAPNDGTVKSNLAATYNHWGLLARSKDEPELALSKLKQGIAMQEALIQSDPNNPQWLAFAAPNYDSAVKILTDLNRPNEAFRYLQKALDARRDLAIRDPNNAARQMSFAASAKAVGDASTSVAQIEAYRDAIRAWKRVAGFASPPASLKKQADSAFAIAQVLADAKDWRDAQSAYWLAKRLFDINLADDPTNAAWRDKAEKAKKAAQDAAAAAVGASNEAAN